MRKLLIVLVLVGMVCPVLAEEPGGSIVSWGDQVTPNAGLTDVVSVAAGRNHSLALKADGSIVGWGRDPAGQATAPAGNDYVAIAAGELHSLALKADGSILGWGHNGCGQSTAPAGNDYVAIAAGGSYSLAISHQVDDRLLSALVEKIISLNLAEGITNSLDAKLDAALNALEDVNENNDVAAINSLQAFINAVEAQRGEKITDAEADTLIDSAQEIIAVSGTW